MTQKANAWMDMDGTMVRRYTQTHTTTWMKPWKDEHDDTKGKRMDGYGRNHGTKIQTNTWAEPWYENEDEDTHTNAQRTFALLLASGA